MQMAEILQPTEDHLMVRRGHQTQKGGASYDQDENGEKTGRGTGQ